MKKREAVLALIAAESEFLKAFGWEEVGTDKWKPPPGYSWEGRTYCKGHAINSQKFGIYRPGGEFAKLERELDSAPPVTHAGSVGE